MGCSQLDTQFASTSTPLISAQRPDVCVHQSAYKMAIHLTGRHIRIMPNFNYLHDDYKHGSRMPHVSFMTKARQ